MARISKIFTTSGTKTAELHLDNVPLDNGEYLILTGIYAPKSKGFVELRAKKYAKVYKRALEIKQGNKTETAKDKREFREFLIDTHAKHIIQSVNVEDSIEDTLKMLPDADLAYMSAFFSNPNNFQELYYDRSEGIQKGKASGKS